MVLADSLPRIRDAVARTLAGGNDACVTFQIAGDERAWVQLAYGTINCAYPRSEPPSVDALPAQLVSALGGIEIVGWEPGNFVTYGFARPEADAITLLVEWLLSALPGARPGEQALDISHEQL